MAQIDEIGRAAPPAVAAASAFASGDGPRAAATTGEAWRRLAEAIGLLGEPEFCAALGDAFSAATGEPRLLVMRYAPDLEPEFVANRAITPEAVAIYRSGLYRLDPLARLARQGGVARIVALSRLREADADNRYYDALFRTMLIGDELAALLPEPDGAWLALCLDRRSGEFSDAEFAAAEAALPCFAALHARHLASRTAAPSRPGPPRPSAAGPARLPAYDDLIAAVALRHGMTAREREITHRALRGYPNVLIARDLGISTGTVRNHRARLYAKLDITTERELFALCLDEVLTSESGSR